MNMNMMATTSQVVMVNLTNAGEMEFAILICVTRIVLTASPALRWQSLRKWLNVSVPRVENHRRATTLRHGGPKIWWALIATRKLSWQASSSQSSLKIWKLPGWTIHGPLNWGIMIATVKNDFHFLRTESIDNFGVGTNTSKRISLNPSSWKPKRLCSGNKLRLKLCLDLSKGSQKETFCEVIIFRRPEKLWSDRMCRSALILRDCELLT